MAKRINILSPEVYNKIAAGEVVERPASALKEIVENSIDAGADTINICVEDGGIGLISVSDNGCGIYEEDLSAVFLKHATSKLSSVCDLESISTLGFRGEALSSIAAVSRITMITRAAKAESGIKVEVEDGKIVSQEYVSANVGTKIEIRDLFYNIPARKKFLKSQSRESAEITKFVSRLILTNPSLKMGYTLDGKEVFQTKGKSLSEALFVIYGEEALENLMPVRYENNFMRIVGYISIPEYIKPNSTYQIISVNGRIVEDKTIQNAIAQAYKPYYVGNGRHYPMYILNMDIPCDYVDVNVHPRKTEVRFQNIASVAGNFYHSAINRIRDYILERNELTFEDTLRKFSCEDSCRIIDDLHPVVNSDSVLLKDAKNMTPAQINDILEIDEQTKKQSKPSLEEFAKYMEENVTVQTARQMIGIDDGKGVKQTAITFPMRGSPEDSDEPPKEKDIAAELLARSRILGTAFKTYLMVELDEKLILIDQHAAHERILFDKFMENKQQNMQPLIFPHVFKVKDDEAVHISNNLDNFLKAGLEVQPFGENTFRITAVSTMFKNADMDKFVSYFLSSMEDFAVNDQELIVEALAKKACKAAVKAGEVLGEQEIKYILRMIYENNVVCCPHGRPVTVVYTKSQLDKMFKRTL